MSTLITGVSPAFDCYPPSCRYNVVAYARVLGPTTVVEVRIPLAG